MKLGDPIAGADGTYPPSPPRPTRAALHLQSAADLGSVIAHIAAQPAGWWEAEPISAPASSVMVPSCEDWPDGPVVPRD